jgi:hypothetical protein
MDDPVAQYFASPNVGTQAASVVQIESSKLVPLIVFLSMMAGLSIAVSVFTLWQAQLAERETRMMEYYVMELDGKLMSAGIIQTEESWSAKKQKRENKR